MYSIGYFFGAALIALVIFWLAKKSTESNGKAFVIALIAFIVFSFGKMALFALLN